MLVCSSSFFTALLFLLIETHKEITTTNRTSIATITGPATEEIIMINDKPFGSGVAELSNRQKDTKLF